MLKLVPHAQSLGESYEDGRSRREAYERMVETILAPARAGRHVCAAFYGHPGISFSRREAIGGLGPRGSTPECSRVSRPSTVSLPTSASTRRERLPDLRGRRLPAAATPRGASGRARPLAGRRRRPGVPLSDGAPVALPELVDALLESYPPDHQLVVYEASPYPGVAPQVESVGLGALTASAVSHRSTVYVPPLAPR